MKANVRLGLILILALSLRLVSLNQSLWLDEAIQAQNVIVNTLSGLITDFFPNDFNPPLSYLISWIMVRLFGESEFWLRLPSVLLGVATVGMGYALARQLLLRKETVSFSWVFPGVFREFHAGGGTVAGLLLATNPLLIYYSQEARPYMLAAFLAAWSMYELGKFMKGKGSVWRFALVTILMLSSHYMTWLLLPAQGLMVIVMKKQKMLRRWVLSLAVAGIFFLPWLPIMLRQVKSGIEVSQSLPVWRQLGELSLKNIGLVPVKFLLGRISLANEFAYGLIAGLLVLGVGALLLLTLLQKRKEEGPKTLLWLWLVVPLILGALLSIKAAVFQYFRFLFIVPAFYLLLVWGAVVLRKPYRGIVIVGLLLVNLISLGIYFLNPQFHREDWRGAVAFIHRQDPTSPIIIFQSVEAPFWYYDRGRSHTVDYSEIDQVRFEKRVWLITYAQPIFEPEMSTQIRLKRFGFEEMLSKDFRGVGVKYLANPAGLTAQIE